jgi:hypothetical protein
LAVGSDGYRSKRGGHHGSAIDLDGETTEQDMAHDLAPIERDQLDQPQSLLAEAEDELNFFITAELGTI